MDGRLQCDAIHLPNETNLFAGWKVNGDAVAQMKWKSVIFKSQVCDTFAHVRSACHGYAVLSHTGRLQIQYKSLAAEKR